MRGFEFQITSGPFNATNQCNRKSPSFATMVSVATQLFSNFCNSTLALALNKRLKDTISTAEEALIPYKVCETGPVEVSPRE